MGGLVIFVLTAAVVAVLVLGLYTLLRGRERTRLDSNKLMQLRVLLQGLAVAVIVIVALIASNRGG